MRTSSKILAGEWAILLSGGADRAAMERALERARAERTISEPRIADIRRVLVEESAAIEAEIEARTRQLRGRADESRSIEHRDAGGWIDAQRVGGPDLKSKEERRVARFLEDRIDLVRVTTENGSGLGHQSAAVAAIRELRELGYKGAIELVVPEGAEAKMVSLIAGYDPSADEQRIGGDLEIRCVRERALKPAGVDRARIIGLVAASDHDDASFSDLLGVDACLVLQPYDWPAPRRLEIRGRPNEELPLPESSTYAFVSRDPLDGVERLLPAEMNALFDFVKQAMIGQPKAIAEKADGILAVFRALKSDRIDLMPVYGLHGMRVADKREVALDNLANGVRAYEARRGGDARAAVILELGPREDGAMTDPGLAFTLRTAQKGEVLVLSAGTLPRPILELLYSYATLPSVLEGANTSNLVQLLGKPFLSVSSVMTGLPRISGVEAVASASNAISIDEAKTQVERLGRLLQMFASIDQQMPPAILAPLRAAIAAGRALSDTERAKMRGAIVGEIAIARPGLAASQAEGFAELVSASMQSLTAALAEITRLDPSVRYQIAVLEPGRGAEILEVCHEAIAAMVADRFASFIDEARDPASRVGGYFERAREKAWSLENRQVVRGLDRMREVLES